MFKFLTSGKITRERHFDPAKGCLEVKKNGALDNNRSSSSCRSFSWYRNLSKRHASYKAKGDLHGTHTKNFPVLTRYNAKMNHAQTPWKSFSQVRFYSGPTSPPRLRTVLSRRYMTMYHAQIAWKRCSQIHFHGGSASPLSMGTILSRNTNMMHRAKLACKRFSHTRSHPRPHVMPLNRIMRTVILALSRSRPVTCAIFASIFGVLTQTQRTAADTEGYFPTGSNLYMHAQDGHAYLTSCIFSVLEGLILSLRAIYLAILFSPTIAMAAFADSFGPQFRKRWLHLVLVTLETAGPAFIKWGQWAATRPDLFPRDLCLELSKLHSNAPSHSFAYTQKSIEKAFGRKLCDIFDDFEEVPLASGSVAQVHRATLRHRNPVKQVKPTVVAVKVRHPGVSESIRKDFVIIHFIAKISNFIPTLKWLRLDESVQQFAVFMMSQVDLSREAAQLNRFIYNFRKSKYVSFPRPLYPLVHPAVLVESYEKGESVSRYIDDNDELQGNDRTKRALADIGTNALLKMLLVDNFIHADMHPGNILVREAQGNPDRKWFPKSKPHVIFLDVGMTAELSRGDQSNLRDFFKAVAVRDGRGAAECTLKFRETNLS